MTEYFRKDIKMDEIPYIISHEQNKWVLKFRFSENVISEANTYEEIRKQYKKYVEYWHLEPKENSKGFGNDLLVPAFMNN